MNGMTVLLNLFYTLFPNKRYLENAGLISNRHWSLSHVSILINFTLAKKGKNQSYVVITYTICISVTIPECIGYYICKAIFMSKLPFGPLLS